MSAGIAFTDLVLHLVVGEGMRLAGVGIALGIVGAIAGPETHIVSLSRPVVTVGDSGQLT